jgi:hypothetical protein
MMPIVIRDTWPHQCFMDSVMCEHLKFGCHLACICLYPYSRCYAPIGKHFSRLYQGLYHSIMTKYFYKTFSSESKISFFFSEKLLEAERSIE